MSDPPLHLLAFRWALVVAVVLAAALVLLLTPWADVAATVDPVVDGLRRSVYS